MLINYDKDVNHAMIEQAALISSVAFSKGDRFKEAYPIIKDAISQIHRTVMTAPLSERKAVCKQIKDSLKEQVGMYLRKGEIPKSPLLQPVCSLDTEWHYKANLLVEIFRWPEFYIHSEQYMHALTADLENHLDMINSITYRDENGKICPYDESIPLIEHQGVQGVWDTIKAQEDSCKEFFRKRNSSKEESEELRISMSDIKEAFEYFLSEVRKPNLSSDIDPSYVDMILEMRNFRLKYLEKVVSRMRSISEGDILYNELTLSESKSVITNERAIQILHKCGFSGNTIPQVLANLFAAKYPSIQLKSYPGQISIDLDAEFFEPALGLGPGFKLRVVFNTHNQANNFLDPLAKALKENHKIDECEDYLHQGKVINDDMGKITDIIDLDATGYSDYLARIIYKLVMTLYGIPEDIQDMVIGIFAFPIKIKNKRYKVLFGTEQGCKLVVFLMNTANRLMGAMARYIYSRLHHKVLDGRRSNTGDDVEDHIFTGTFDKEYLMIQISIFTLFNCPTNLSKCGWLSRDGIVSYCSRYYTYDDSNQIICISALPPKTLGKQITSFSSFAQLFKNLGLHKIYHRSALDTWNIVEPLIGPYIQEATRLLPNIYGSHNNYDEKLRQAKQTDVILGGLLEDQWKFNYPEFIARLRYKLSHVLSVYTFRASGVYVVANLLMKEEDRDTELFRRLATTQETTIKDVMKLFDILTDEDNIYEESDLDWCNETINKMERCIIKGTSFSSSSSTYHRRTPKKDLDIFYDTSREMEYNFFDNWYKRCDNPLRSLCRFIGYYANENYVPIDKIRMYYHNEALLKEFEVEVYSGSFGDLDYEKLRVYDPWKGKYVRINETDSDYRNTKYGKTPNFIVYADASPKIKEFIDAYESAEADPVYKSIQSVLNNIVSGISSNMIKKLLEDQIIKAYNVSRPEARRIAKAISKTVTERII